MRYDWFKQFSIYQFESIQSNFDPDQDQDTIFGNRLLWSYVLHVDDAHEIKFSSTKFFQIFTFSSHTEYVKREKIL